MKQTNKAEYLIVYYREHSSETVEDDACLFTSASYDAMSRGT